MEGKIRFLPYLGIFKKDVIFVKPLFHLCNSVANMKHFIWICKYIWNKFVIMHERFIEYMAYKKYTVRKLSRLSCVSSSTLSRFCSGKEINLGSLLKLLQVCDDLSLEWFFFGTGDMLRNRNGMSVNMGAFAGADVDNREGVLINGSKGVNVEKGEVLRYQKLLEEKDKVISERDKTIKDLLDRIVRK